MLGEALLCQATAHTQTLACLLPQDFRLDAGMKEACEEDLKSLCQANVASMEEDEGAFTPRSTVCQGCWERSRGRRGRKGGQRLRGPSVRINHDWSCTHSLVLTTLPRCLPLQVPAPAP
jgi:hypothetical protein